MVDLSWVKHVVGGDRGPGERDPGERVSNKRRPAERASRVPSVELFQPAFMHELKDLGEAEHPSFAGVYSPAPEVGRKREGVNAAFLSDAEEYYRKHQGFQYWKDLFSKAFTEMGIRDASLVVEYGCGFGNATLPILELVPSARVIASDISPNLLSIGKRLIDARGESDRCIFVAMDAQQDYLRENIADVVTGSAILHHLAEPRLLLQSAVRVLKPGGCAIFFEPFEMGYAIIRMVLLDIVLEAWRRRFVNPVVKWADAMANDLAVQIRREKLPGWRDKDDKWVFPRAFLQDIADDIGAELIVYPIEGSAGKFRTQITYMMAHDAGLDLADVPDWAWALIDRVDNDLFSPEIMPDLIIGGAVIFKKR